MSLMTKLTPQELDERIAELVVSEDDIPYVKQLIRDCIEAVTPERGYTPDFLGGNTDWMKGYNQAIDTIEANTKELLGNTNTEGNK